MRTTIAAVASATALAGGVLTALPASAAPPADVKLTTQILNHADNGHGTPSHWADDTWTRVTLVHANGDGTFKVTLQGTGKFRAIKDAGSPNGTGAKVKRAVGGQFTETMEATVTGSLKSKVALHNLDGTTYNDKHQVHKTTGQWLVTPFKAGATAHITSYAYTYAAKGGCEVWTDSSDNNDGQGAAAGNVTGKHCQAPPPVFVPSVLKVQAKCRYSKTDKRQLWTVTNVAGGRSRDFWSWVKSPNPHPGQRADGWLYLGKHTVGPGQTFNLTTGWGGVLSVHYYNGKGELQSVHAASNHKVVCS
jgi:hypothetical protein